MKYKPNAKNIISDQIQKENQKEILKFEAESSIKNYNETKLTWVGRGVNEGRSAFNGMDGIYIVWDKWPL